MVGGDVIGIVRTHDSTLLNVRDRTYGDTCAVRCVERRRETGEPVAIEVGDKVWWQGQDVMWTSQRFRGSVSGPGCGITWDIHLPKVGFSH
jgi:hypothetical protein